MAVPAPSPLDVTEVKPYKSLSSQISFTNKTPINNTLNRLVALLDMQFATVEATREELEAALEDIMQVAIDRMNEVFTPLIEEAQRRLEEFGANFSAHSSTQLLVQSPADFGLYIDEVDRAGYVYSDYVALRYGQDDTQWMICDVLDYNRTTGYLQVHSVQSNGVGQYSDWNVRMTVAPDLAHANRTDNPHQTTAEQVGAYTKGVSDFNDGLTAAAVRGGVISTYDTLQKLYTWATNSFNTRLRIDAVAGYTPATKQLARINAGIAPGFADYFVQSTSTQAAGLLMGVASKRILNINSGFQVAQEYGSGVCTAIAGQIVWPIDGWMFQNNCNAAWNISRGEGFYSPGGSRYMLVLTTTTADPTMDPGQYCIIKTAIEGTDVQQLAWGTGLARPIIVRFTLRSPLAGPLSIVISNEDGTRSYCATFTVAPADIGADKVYYFTIPGDTQGTWRTDNRTGMFLSFAFAVHSSLTTLTPNQWLGGLVYGPSGSLQGVGATNLIWVLGDVAVYDGQGMLPSDYPNYQLPSITAENDRCKRRWQKVTVGHSFYYAGSSPTYLITNRWPVAMRAVPTLGTAGMFYYPGYTTFTPNEEYFTISLSGYPTVNTPLAITGPIIGDARI